MDRFQTRHSNHLNCKTLSILVLLVITPAEGFSMSIFDFLKLCLFSELNGTVTLNGSPVAEAKITQTAIWQQTTYIHVTHTDAQGRFHFDSFNKHSIGAILPHEPIVWQKMTITHNDKEYLAWETTKRDYNEGDEFEGKPIRIACELSDSVKDTYIRNDRQLITGICNW